MSYVSGRTAILTPNRTITRTPVYVSGPIEGEIPGRDGYTSGRPNPVTETTGTGTVPASVENPILKEIETEWRAWWKEHYGTDYQPADNTAAGRVFLNHLNPLANVTDAVKSSVLAVLKGREAINAEIGRQNFITFGSLFFRYVGDGQSVEAAKERAVREIKGDAVLYSTYVTGDGNNPGKNTNTLLYAGAGAGLIFLLTRKKKRK